MSRRKRIAHFVEFKGIAVFLILFIIPFAISYGEVEDEHSEELEETSQNFSSILPFKYLENGEYFSAILVVVFWVAIFKGVYELSLMVASKVIEKEE